MSSSSSSSSSDGSDRDVARDERVSQNRKDSSSSDSSSDSGSKSNELGSRERIPSIESSPRSIKSNKLNTEEPLTSRAQPELPSRSNSPAKSSSPAPSIKSQSESVKSASSSRKSSPERLPSPPPPKSVTPVPRTPTPPPKTPTPPPKSPESVASKKKSTASSSSSSSSESEEDTTKKEVPKIAIPPPRKSSISLNKRRSQNRLSVKMKSPTSMNDDVFENKTPPKPRTPKSARFKPSQSSEEPVECELHIMKYRNTRSAPARPRAFYAESSNLAFLKRECDKIEKSMKRTAKSSLGKRPKITPYKPFTWNSLAPYYNTDTLRYMIHMPVTVRRGYNTRATASGMVDPEVSWKMDHCLTPMTPSRPELFRHHFTKRRTQSAMPRLSSEHNVLTPRFPKVTQVALEEPKRKQSGRNSSLK